MTDSFRNVGPQVFISYCFKDKETALRVSAFLTAQGCRVRMEDEVSLIGHRLELILPERIRQAEAFVQLRTASAGLSSWIKKELEYASAPREGNSQPVLAPLVFEHRDLAMLSDASRAIDATCGLIRFSKFSRHGLPRRFIPYL
jgi:TIR domain